MEDVSELERIERERAALFAEAIQKTGQPQNRSESR
jgi:hypothetical protein